MKKKLLFFALAVIVIIGSILTTRYIRECNSKKLFNANLEALLEPEAYTKGTGVCFQDYDLVTNALFLSCTSCIYIYGVPKYYWMRGNCD